MTNSRHIAFRVLRECNRENRPFQSVLAGELREHPEIEPRDRRLARQLVAGVISRRLTLDWIIGKFSKKPVNKIEPDILNALRLGVYQLFFLDRIPDRASVNETVALIKKNHPKWVVGFVNGVLRAVQRNRESVSFTNRDDDLVDNLAVLHSHPPWLVKRWIERYGKEKTTELLKTNNSPAPRTIRVNTHLIGRSELTVRLREEGFSADPTTFSPVGLTIRERTGPLYETSSFKDGLWTAQDEGAQIISYLLPVVHGGQILDLCAGRGGKLGHLARLSLNAAGITAVETSRKKLPDLERTKNEITGIAVNIFHGDASLFAEQRHDSRFDGILADVPCSGTGTIRRYPDIKWKDFANLLPRTVRTQREILTAASKLVAANGFILYATCSLEPEENEKNVEWFVNNTSGFKIMHLATNSPPFIHPLIDGQGFYRTWPPSFEMDGFFAALIKKTG